MLGWAKKIRISLWCAQNELFYLKRAHFLWTQLMPDPPLRLNSSPSPSSVPPQSPDCPAVDSGNTSKFLVSRVCAVIMILAVMTAPTSHHLQSHYFVHYIH